MEYISGNKDFKLNNSAVTLGKFDGLHKGHQKLINKVVELNEAGYHSVMFTFMYHPCSIFAKNEINLIYTEKEKRLKLSESGLDYMISYPLTKETASMKPEDFIKDILIDKIGAKVIVVGSDFHFGHNRAGDVTLLKELSKKYDYELIVFEKIENNHEIIGSTLIREEILKGNIQLANELLGRPFSIIGEVIHGRKLGRTIGVPTTNLIPEEEKLLPPNGVYASKTILEGKEYEGVTNIGFKPTVGADPMRGVETYLFDFDRDIYGKIVEVQLFEMERGEEKYSSIDELKEQMQKDILYAKEFFKNINR